MRVPCIIRWPGKIPAGVVTNEMLAAVDWLPTLAGMAGASKLVPKDRPIDGMDAASLTRQQHADLITGVIVEGPHDWPVRPVAEIFYERDFGEGRTGSALIGAIWQAKADVAIDVGVRGARVDSHTEGEIRAGITFAFTAP